MDESVLRVFMQQLQLPTFTPDSYFDPTKKTALSDREAERKAIQLVKFYSEPGLHAKEYPGKLGYLPENLVKFFLMHTNQLESLTKLEYDFQKMVYRAVLLQKLSTSRFFAKALVKRKSILRDLCKYLTKNVEGLREPHEVHCSCSQPLSCDYRHQQLGCVQDVLSTVSEVVTLVSPKKNVWKALLGFGYHEIFTEILKDISPEMDDIWRPAVVDKVFTFLGLSAHAGVFMKKQVLLQNVDLFCERCIDLISAFKEIPEPYPGKKDEVLMNLTNFLSHLCNKVPGAKEQILRNSKLMKFAGDVPVKFLGRTLRQHLSGVSRTPINLSGVSVAKDSYKYCAFSRCGKSGIETKLKTCSACYTAYYCSADCQKKDWKRHKKLCIISREKKKQSE